eukprot:gene39490-48080_t
MWKQADEGKIAGAGAILFSKLCAEGFSPPAVALSEHDEKVLFDLEVKLKLKHASARSQLWTIVADFPASVLLQRHELLIVLLNGVGAPFSHEDVVADPLGLHAVGYLRALWLLLSKVRNEVEILCDGGLVSYMHTQCVSGNKKSFLKADDVFSSDALMEQALSLRYPSSSFCSSASSVSVSGLAFAVLAAALPLLRSRSLMVMQVLGDMAGLTLDLAFEPSFDFEGNAHDTNLRRARHLFDRLEQLTQSLSLERFLSVDQDAAGNEGDLDSTELADRCFLSCFSRFTSDVLISLRRSLGDLLAIPTHLSRLEHMLSYKGATACWRVPLLPACSLYTRISGLNSHIALRTSLSVLSASVQFDLLEGIDGDVPRLLQLLADLLDTLPMSRAEQESYILCLSAALRLLLKFSGASHEPHRSALHLQILGSLLASVNRLSKHTVSCFHQSLADSSIAPLEEPFVRSVHSLA